MIIWFTIEKDVIPVVRYQKFSIPTTTDVRYVMAASVEDIDQWRFSIVIIG